MGSNQENTLIFGKQQQSEAPKWPFRQVKRSARFFDSKSHGLTLPIQFWDSPQVYDWQPERLSWHNSLNGLAISDHETRAHRFMPSQDFLQRALQDRDVHRALETQVEIFVIVNPLFQLVEKPHPLLPSREGILVLILPACDATPLFSLSSLFAQETCEQRKFLFGEANVFG
jgi:hypothetical protein